MINIDNYFPSCNTAQNSKDLAGYFKELESFLIKNNIKNYKTIETPGEKHMTMKISNY